jgi:hypothetical protein
MVLFKLEMMICSCSCNQKIINANGYKKEMNFKPIVFQLILIACGVELINTICCPQLVIDVSIPFNSV